MFVRELGEEGLREAVASNRYSFTAESPALVVGGAGERLNTFHRARSAQLASWLPRSETRVLPGVSHAMPLEDPALIARTVEDFVARHSG